MKLKKTFALTLILCLLMSVMGIGVLTSAAYEDPDQAEAYNDALIVETEPDIAFGVQPEAVAGVAAPGGWEFSDVAADNCTSEEKEILAKALEDNLGVSFEPVDVIASQVVAGINYAFLCKAAPVVPDAEYYWAIVTVYVDPSGKTSLVNIVEIDPAAPAILDESAASSVDADGVPASGGWLSVKKDNEAPLDDTVKAALQDNDGVGLSAIAELGTQVVSGVNHRILAYGTTATAQPVTDLYVVDVYKNLSGEAEITAINRFDLAAYVAPRVPEEDIEEETEPETEAATVPAEDPTSSEKSPNTGVNGSMVFVIVMLALIASFGAGVSVIAIVKKRG